MAAGEGVSGRRLDRVSGRYDAAVPDPWPVDAGRQLDQRREDHTEVVSHQCVQARSLVLIPVEIDRQQDHVRDSKQGEAIRLPLKDFHSFKMSNSTYPSSYTEYSTLSEFLSLSMLTHT